MNTTNGQEPKAVNQLENGMEAKTIHPHASDQDSSVVGDSAPRPARPRRGRPVTVKVKGGELIERQFQRRNNINSLPGLIREHARLIQLIRNGEIALDRGEMLSRAYGRHKEMVTALEQRTALAAIQAQLEALRAGAGVLPIHQADPLVGGEVES
jgi:hypothetical protein